MATSSREENSDLVDQFIAVTGANRATAISMLEACAGNLDMAVGMHMDGQGAAGSSEPIPDRAGPASSDGPMDAAGNVDDDDIRAPIPQRTEVLVEDDGYSTYGGAWRMKRLRRTVRSVFDGFRDFQAETKNYEAGISHGKSSSKKRNLEDLFRPPVDVTHKGTFQTARDEGSSSNKWVLVNVQNVQEFECQVLNRDVWSCPMAKTLISKHFVFWQVYNDSVEGKRFMQFYKVNIWPHVAIVDPFTGENQVTWNKISDGKIFCELANDFLSTNPVPNTNDTEGSPKAKRPRQNSIVDASEQDQLEAAIQASLQASKPPPLYVVDSDSEADIIEDSDDEVDQTFSDSDTAIESSPDSKHNKDKNSATKSPNCKNSSSSSSPAKSSTKYSSSPTSPSSSLSTSKHATNGNRPDIRKSLQRKVSKKDVLSKCKNLSTSTKTSCSYTPPGTDLLHSDRLEGAGSSVLESPLDDRVDSRLSNSLGEGGGEPCSTSTNSPSPHTSHTHWKQYWGHGDDPVSKIMMRFPDSRREQLELPCTSSLKALKVYCSSNGFPVDKYELVTNFPRRQLSDMDEDKTLKDCGLFPQETVFIQEL